MEANVERAVSAVSDTGRNHVKLGLNCPLDLAVGGKMGEQLERNCA